MEPSFQVGLEPDPEMILKQFSIFKNVMLSCYRAFGSSLGTHFFRSTYGGYAKVGSQLNPTIPSEHGSISIPHMWAPGGPMDASPQPHPLALAAYRRRP